MNSMVYLYEPVMVQKSIHNSADAQQYTYVVLLVTGMIVMHS